MGTSRGHSYGYYERVESLVSAAPSTLSVAYLEECEAHGEPWPISGDATAIKAGAEKWA